MADDESNHFGYVQDMGSHDHTSLSPGVDRDYEDGGRLEDTEERISRAKKAAVGGTGLLGAGATYGIAGEDLRELGLDPAQYADEAVEVAAEYLNEISGEVAGYMADPQNVERAAEASQFVNEIVANLG